MSLPEHLRNLRSGAINEGTEHLYGDGPHAHQAAAIADAILSEPANGSGGGRYPGGAKPGEWNHERDSTARGDNRHRPSGIPYGYGDPRAR